MFQPCGYLLCDGSKAGRTAVLPLCILVTSLACKTAGNPKIFLRFAEPVRDRFQYLKVGFLRIIETRRIYQNYAGFPNGTPSGLYFTRMRFKVMPHTIASTPDSFAYKLERFELGSEECQHNTCRTFSSTRRSHDPDNVNQALIRLHKKLLTHAIMTSSLPKSSTPTTSNALFGVTEDFSECLEETRSEKSLKTLHDTCLLASFIVRECPSWDSSLSRSDGCAIVLDRLAIEYSLAASDSDDRSAFEWGTPCTEHDGCVYVPERIVVARFPVTTGSDSTDDWSLWEVGAPRTLIGSCALVPDPVEIGQSLETSVSACASMGTSRE